MLQAQIHPRDNMAPMPPPGMYRTSMPLQGLTKQEPKTIEFLWRLYNSFPKQQPRLQKTYAAARRMTARRRDVFLPPRKSFMSTVDYFEAAAPLYMSQQRFTEQCMPPRHFRGILSACVSIIPKKLF